VYGKILKCIRGHNGRLVHKRLSQETLAMQYLVLGKSVKQIARDCGVHGHTPSEWLKHYGIPQRSLSEACRLVNHTWGFGKNAPVFRNNEGRRYPCRAGKREALGGLFVRSRWENNYALWLIRLQEQGEILGWKYEWKTFVFHKIKRGTRSYTPDFAIWETSKNPKQPDYYIEVKGYMDKISKTRLSRMERYYPQVKIILVDSKWFNDAEKKGICRLFPGWECSHTQKD